MALFDLALGCVSLKLVNGARPEAPDIEPTAAIIDSQSVTTLRRAGARRMNAVVPWEAFRFSRLARRLCKPPDKRHIPVDGA